MKKDESKRQPIITVLGHVDHGKTSLLDAIRKTNVQKKEAGGITQSIGASVVTTKEKKNITFVDTPGHAAFKEMRSRGANVADMAILVVAVDDGVKPQTKEAIKHIRSADIPYIVALTKVDLNSANIETSKKSLEDEGVLLEGRGGEVPTVEVSAKSGKGIDDLLETITLLAEVNGIGENVTETTEAVVIETGKDKRGPTVSVVIKNGSLKVGENIESEGKVTKIRGLFNFEGVSVKEITVGNPTQILGFEELPFVGSVITEVGKSTKVAKEIKKNGVSVEENEIPVVVKAKSAGSLEALINSIPEKVKVVSSGVGNVTESDIFVAKSAGSASLFVFEAKVSSQVKNLARTEGVEIVESNIIYEHIQELEKRVKGKEKIILGKAEILASFPFNKKSIAGSKVISGEIKKGSKLTLFKKDKEVGISRVVSLKKQKEEIEIAKMGEECGILLAPQLDFEIGDVLVSVENE